MEHSIQTHRLIEKIEKLNLRQEIPFEQDKIIECLKKIDILLGREPIKKIEKIDIFREFALEVYNTYLNYSAYSDFSKFSTYSAYSVYSNSLTFLNFLAYSSPLFSSVNLVLLDFRNSSAYLASTAYSTSSTYLSSSFSVDYNFQEFIYSFEWNLKNEGNDNDKLFLEIQHLLLEAKEYGLGYVFRKEDTLFIFPASIVQVENNRFHSTTKPAIIFDDETQIYYLEGIRFDKPLWQKVVNQELSVQEAINLENIEQRTIALKYLGWDKVLSELQAQSIFQDDYGEILEIDLKDDDKPARFLKFKDPAKNYETGLLRIRPEFKTTQEALTHHYQLGIVNKIYAPNVRT